MIIELLNLSFPLETEVFGDSEEGEGSGGGGWGGSEAPGGHSRNSSNTSHASGYASINSQSEKSGHIR